MSNMEFWDKVKQPPDHALKTIGGGRLKGLTDINPQWRYQALTEEFGMCGIGWKYTIDKVWSVDTCDSQVFAFAEISLFIKNGEVWSDAISGIGGSMLVAKESSGLHASDEGYKMAVTDALSVACKALGIGANIYAGLSDTKYNKPKEENGKPATLKNTTTTGHSMLTITHKQRELLYNKMTKDNDLTDSEAGKFMNWYKAKVKENPLSAKQASEFITNFDKYLGEFTKSPEV